MSRKTQAEKLRGFYRFLTKGVRIRAFKKLIWAGWWLKNQRYKNLDWSKWKARDPKNREHLHHDFLNYLYMMDKRELAVFREYLGCSERTAKDYWVALRRLKTHVL